jgi:Uma2 family endonuclease
MASAARTRQVATYADLCAVPSGQVAEIVAGVLHTSPRPAMPHGMASSALGAEVVSAFQFGRGGPGGWWIFDEPELHLSDDVLVPDLAGWRRERMPDPPAGAYVTLAPDWVCEVVSPGTERHDRVSKLPVYARERVGHLWLINPIERMLEVYRRDAERWLLVATHGDAALVRAEPFDAIEIDLLHLWGETRA